MDWRSLFPNYFPSNGNNGIEKQVEFLDVGCGYGGLLGIYYFIFIIYYIMYKIIFLSQTLWITHEISRLEFNSFYYIIAIDKKILLKILFKIQ